MVYHTSVNININIKKYFDLFIFHFKRRKKKKYIYIYMWHNFLIEMKRPGIFQPKIQYKKNHIFLLI